MLEKAGPTTAKCFQVQVQDQVHDQVLGEGPTAFPSGGGLPQDASEGATKGLGDRGKTGGGGARESVLAGEYGREGGKGRAVHGRRRRESARPPLVQQEPRG